MWTWSDLTRDVKPFQPTTQHGIAITLMPEAQAPLESAFIAFVLEALSRAVVDTGRNSEATGEVTKADGAVYAWIVVMSTTTRSAQNGLSSSSWGRNGTASAYKDTPTMVHPSNALQARGSSPGTYQPQIATNIKAWPHASQTIPDIDFLLMIIHAMRDLFLFDREGQFFSIIEGKEIVWFVPAGRRAQVHANELMEALADVAWWVCEMSRGRMKAVAVDVRRKRTLIATGYVKRIVDRIDRGDILIERKHEITIG